MEKFASLEIGNEFFSTTTISSNELEEYLGFSRIKNALFEIDTDDKSKKIVSGRAIISRLEGEFTRLRQIYGNYIILYGADGDINWENRQTRFLKSLYTNQVLKIKFTISEKKELDDEFGLIGVDFEGSTEDGELVLISKKNLYRIKKNPPSNL